MIAPTLNEEVNIQRFLDSLFNQTFKDFEVIIVDGGSTDRSYQLLAKYSMVLRLFTVVDRTRNFGYIRNLGAKYAKGNIMLHCNTDNYLEPRLLEKLVELYNQNPNVVSIGGRIYPVGTSLFGHLSYQCFDFIRWLFTCFPKPFIKYRPSGNFMSVRSKVFWDVGGHPEVEANEDGLFGQKLDGYIKKNHKTVIFSLKLYMGHDIKKFRQMGNVQAILFYFYIFGNYLPFLKSLLDPIQRNANSVFKGDSPLRKSIRQLVNDFWCWL